MSAVNGEQKGGGDVEQGVVANAQPGMDRAVSRTSTNKSSRNKTFMLRLTTLFKFQKPKKRAVDEAETEKVLFGMLTKDQFFMIKAAFG